MLPIFPYFAFNLDKIRYWRCTRKLWTHREFHKNGRSLRRQTNCYPFFFQFYRLTRSAIRYTRSARHVVQQLSVLLKSAEEKPYSSYGLKLKHIYARTVKPYDVVYVKNSLTKSISNIINIFQNFFEEAI